MESIEMVIIKVHVHENNMAYQVLNEEKCPTVDKWILAANESQFIMNIRAWYYSLYISERKINFGCFSYYNHLAVEIS